MPAAITGLAVAAWTCFSNQLISKQISPQFAQQLIGSGFFKAVSRGLNIMASAPALAGASSCRSRSSRKAKVRLCMGGKAKKRGACYSALATSMHAGLHGCGTCCTCRPYSDPAAAAALGRMTLQGEDPL